MAFTLRSSTVGALPLVNHYLQRLHIPLLLSRYLPPPDPRSSLRPAVTLQALLRCLILNREPLYSVIEWAATVHPALLDCSLPQLSQLNDDRIGRSLDRLFDSECTAFLTDFVLRLIKEFSVPLDQLHNDSTTLSFQGNYLEADGTPMRGRPTRTITFGHNKDHRVDLKQLLWILTVTEEGVPVHFKVADGNTPDVRTHLETWTVLRSLVGRPDFLYVADSKLCSRATLRAIHAQQGRFLTVLPRTRKEEAGFKKWLLAHLPDWQPLASYPHPQRKDGPADVVRFIPSPFPDPDGFRLLWFHSSLKEERDVELRQEALNRAVEELQSLKDKLDRPRSRLKTREGIVEKAEAILKHRKVDRWLHYIIEESPQEDYRQEKRGRSGARTRYRRTVMMRFHLRWETLDKILQEDARADGIFPLLTNCLQMPALEVLEAYRKKHPLIEKRHEMLKTVLKVVPVYLKNIGRVEALLFLAYIALSVHALIERDIRRAMSKRGMKKINLYPEERVCRAPTAARIFELFAPLQFHRLIQGEKVTQVFMPELSETQEQVLTLLGLSRDRFLKDLD
jgi:transposase